MSLNTPGIRPAWAVVDGDDQKRVVTSEEAIINGVNRVIIGRPITQASNPRLATEKTLEEIAIALEEKAKKTVEKNKPIRDSRKRIPFF